MSYLMSYLKSYLKRYSKNRVKKLKKRIKTLTSLQNLGIIYHIHYIYIESF